MRNDQAVQEENRPLKVFVVSDVHLNNHPYEREQMDDNPRRRNFHLFLTQLNNQIQPNERLILILNGDILDITGSWSEPILPWESPESVREEDVPGLVPHTQTMVQQTVHRLVLEIMENNLSTFRELRRFLEHPQSEIVYLFGNHDSLLQNYPDSQVLIRDFLASLALNPEDSPPKDHSQEILKAPPQIDLSERLRFATFFESRSLDLYVEHGHRLDPVNYSDTSQPALGDVITILVVNRFVELSLKRFWANGYSENFIRQMHTRLHDIEYLRPLSLVPVWIKTLASQYESHPESQGKTKTISTILIEVISEIFTDILQDQEITRFLKRQLRLPKTVIVLCVTTMLRIPAILPLISFIGSQFTRKTHSNQTQYNAARHIHQIKGCRLIAFGHTHIPEVKPVSESAYYFNTGSWKPVINLFKTMMDQQMALETLNPMEVRFNKVERAGILCLEKENQKAETPVSFSLQTIQNGFT